MNLIMENWRQYISETNWADMSPEERQAAFSAGTQKLAKRLDTSDPTKSKMFNTSRQERAAALSKAIGDVGPDDWAKPEGKGQMCRIFGTIVELTWRDSSSAIRDASRNGQIPDEVKDIASYLIGKSTPIFKDLMKTITIELAHEFAPKFSSSSHSGNVEVPVARAGYSTLEEGTKKIVKEPVYNKIYKKIKHFIVKRLLLMIIPFLNKAYVTYQLYRLGSCISNAREGVARKYTKKLEALIS